LISAPQCCGPSTAAPLSQAWVIHRHLIKVPFALRRLNANAFPNDSTPLESTIPYSVASLRGTPPLTSRDAFKMSVAVGPRTASGGTFKKKLIGIWR
jgi:hypothetical protein